MNDDGLFKFNCMASAQRRRWFALPYYAWPFSEATLDARALTIRARGTLKRLSVGPTVDLSDVREASVVSGPWKMVMLDAADEGLLVLVVSDPTASSVVDTLRRRGVSVDQRKWFPFQR